MHTLEGPTGAAEGASGASTSHHPRNDDGGSSFSSDEDIDNARSNHSTHRPSGREFSKILYDYSNLIFDKPSSSHHIGKIPQFDGTGYSKWKNSMEEYFMAVNPALWNLVNRGITFQVEMLL
jgi:hypothetical protein